MVHNRFRPSHEEVVVPFSSEATEFILIRCGVHVFGYASLTHLPDQASLTARLPGLKDLGRVRIGEAEHPVRPLSEGNVLALIAEGCVTDNTAFLRALQALFPGVRPRWVDSPYSPEAIGLRAWGRRLRQGQGRVRVR